MTPTLRDLAEDAFAYLPGPQVEIEHRPAFVLRNEPGVHPFHGNVLRPRLPDVDAGLTAAREWFTARGRDRYIWAVAGSSEPSDLGARLLERGLVPDELDPVYAGMILEREPAAVHGVVARKVENYEEALAGTSALVVQAGAMSKPILQGLGFETVCEMRTFVDSAA